MSYVHRRWIGKLKSSLNRDSTVLSIKNRTSGFVSVVRSCDGKRSRWTRLFRNCSLFFRDKMRGPRKKAKEQSIKDQVLLKKASLNMKLLPDSETDGKMASLLRLKSSSTSEEKEAKLRENITEESIFTAQWDIFTNFISINMIH